MKLEEDPEEDRTFSLYRPDHRWDRCTHWIDAHTVSDWRAQRDTHTDSHARTRARTHARTHAHTREWRKHICAVHVDFELGWSCCHLSVPCGGTIYMLICKENLQTFSLCALLTLKQQTFSLCALLTLKQQTFSLCNLRNLKQMKFTH